MQQPSKNIIICGGGTGGHIFPAIAIANALKLIDNNINILFVGARNKIEMKVVPEAGYKIIGLPVSGFRRSLSLKNLSFIFKLIVSLIKSEGILKSFKPHLVLGVGGYASGPMMRMAFRRNIPGFIQEQNSYPGVTNRILAKKAEKIFVAYEGMDKYFKPDKLLLSGNPVRQDLESLTDKLEQAHLFFGMEKDKKTIFVFGGSQGAQIINQCIFKNINLLHSSGFQLIWQTGKSFFTQAQELIKDLKITNIKVYDFIKRMDLAYAISDLVICRAGAGAISEICITGKPAILIPYSMATGDHQTKNAMAMVENKAAKMIKENEAEKSLINTAIETLNNESEIKEIKNNILKMKKSNSAKIIAEEIIIFLKGRPN